MNQEEELTRWNRVVEKVRSDFSDRTSMFGGRIIFLEEVSPLMEDNEKKILTLNFKTKGACGVSKAVFGDLIEESVKDFFGPDVQVEFKSPEPKKQKDEDWEDSHKIPKQMILPTKPVVFNNGFGRLNPKLTLDSFITGPSNRDSFERVKLFAGPNSESGIKNLFLVGDTGLGKTHLMQGLCHEVADKLPPKKVLYLCGSMFTSLFVSAAKKKFSDELDELRQKMTSCDFLVIDGVHSLQGKKQTQIFLLSILEELENRKSRNFAGTSVIPPEQFENFSEELRSRLIGGWRAELNLLDLETRDNIIDTLARSLIRPPFSKKLIARLGVLDGDVRQIRGVLEDIKLRIEISPQTSTEEVVEETLALFAFSKQTMTLTLDGILERVCSSFKVTPEKVKSKSKKAIIVRPRHIFFYLARQLTDKTDKSIGKFADRSHSSVIYGVEEIAKKMRTNHKFSLQVQFLKEKLEKEKRKKR